MEKSHLHLDMNSTHARERGFTLLEIVITAVILLFLASMAVPAFQDTVADADVASTRSMLARLRTAVDFYAFQHQEDMPGEISGTGVWSASTFDSHLRLASDVVGSTAVVGTAGYPFGPYLNEPIPANPFNELATVTVVQPGGDYLGADDTSGWVYWAATGAIRANSTELAPDGSPIWDL